MSKESEKINKKFNKTKKLTLKQSRNHKFKCLIKYIDDD